MSTKKHIHRFKIENHEVTREVPKDVELKYVIPVDTSVQTLAVRSGGNFTPTYSGDNIDISTQDLMQVKQRLIQLKYEEQDILQRQKAEVEKYQQEARDAQILTEAQKIVESQKILE